MTDDPVQETKTAVRLLTDAVIRVDALTRELANSESDLKLRVQAAEQRAAVFEQRADEHQQKAERTDQLEQLAHELVDALDRLPRRMDDAGMMESIVPPEIPLYGTWDWQAVMEAKFKLQDMLGKEV